MPTSGKDKPQLQGVEENTKKAATRRLRLIAIKTVYKTVTRFVSTPFAVSTLIKYVPAA